MKRKTIKAGDLVQADDWVVEKNNLGLVVEVQPEDYCSGAWVLFNSGVKLIRIENLYLMKVSQK